MKRSTTTSGLSLITFWKKAIKKLTWVDDERYNLKEETQVGVRTFIPSFNFFRRTIINEITHDVSKIKDNKNVSGFSKKIINKTSK